MFRTMLRILGFGRRPPSSNPFDLLVEQPRPIRFWSTYRKGASVSATVPDHGESLRLSFKRPVERDDVLDGKLTDCVSSGVQRRGGKRLTELELTRESAVALYAVLGSALKDAEVKHNRRVFAEHLFKTVMSFADTQRRCLPSS